MAGAPVDGAALDRATGALLGLAVGDAMGMPTQLLSRSEVVAAFGPVLDGFAPGAPDHPIAPGLPAGTVTDDTEQAVLLGRLLVSGGGRVEPRQWAAALADWEADLVRRGSADLLGPSTRRAIAAVASGVPPRLAGRHGDTDGAAMRIAPVGIATPPGAGLAGLVDAVVAVSEVTHGTAVALAGAVAVAAAVSAAVDGATVTEALDTAVRAAPAGAARGVGTGGADLAGRIAAALAMVAAVASPAPGVAGPDRPSRVADLLAGGIGTSMATVEAVPAALAVVSAFPDDPWTAVRVAASAGGDSDTVAAMAGAVLGACHGTAGFPAAARDLVEQVNALDLAGLAADLLALRQRRRDHAAGAARGGGPG